MNSFVAGALPGFYTYDDAKSNPNSSRAGNIAGAFASGAVVPVAATGLIAAAAAKLLKAKNPVVAKNLRDAALSQVDILNPSMMMKHVKSVPHMTNATLSMSKAEMSKNIFTKAHAYSKAMKNAKDISKLYGVSINRVAPMSARSIGALTGVVGGVAGGVANAMLVHGNYTRGKRDGVL